MQSMLVRTNFLLVIFFLFAKVEDDFTDLLTLTSFDEEAGH